MAKQFLQDLTVLFIPPWSVDHKNMKEKNIPRWLFEGSTTSGKNKLPDGLDWPCYLDGSSKNHHGLFFSFIFL